MNDKLKADLKEAINLALETAVRCPTVTGAIDALLQESLERGEINISFYGGVPSALISFAGDDILIEGGIRIETEPYSGKRSLPQLKDVRNQIKGIDALMTTLRDAREQLTRALEET